MIIAIIVLSIVILIGAGVILAYNRLLKQTIKERFKVKVYPYHLLVTMHYNAKKVMTITDFSQYKKLKLIAHTVYITGPPPDERAQLIDGVTTTVPPAAVPEIAKGVSTCIL